MARFRRLLLCAALVLLLACGAEAWAKKKKAKDEVNLPPTPLPSGGASALVCWMRACGAGVRRGSAPDAGSGPRGAAGRRRRACTDSPARAEGAWKRFFFVTSAHVFRGTRLTSRTSAGPQARPASGNLEGSPRFYRAEGLHEARWHQQNPAVHHGQDNQ